MKTKTILTQFLLYLLLLTAFCPVVRSEAVLNDAETKYGGGTGEPNSPFLIYTAEQLNTIGTNSEDRDKHFRLMNDIDLGSIRTTFNVIGSVWTGPFRGVFDGNTHVIYNLKCDTQDVFDFGLFGSLYKAEIKNLGLIDPNVEAGSANNVGSMINSLYSSTIMNCYVRGGKVSGMYDVGGLIGYSEGSTITNCHAEEVNVNGIDGVGGLIGTNPYSSKITNCYSSGIVQAGDQVGGLIGFGRGTITDCYSSSYILGTGQQVGGLVGQSYGDISSCYADGNVLGDTEVSGLVGQNYGTIINCKAGGEVQGYKKVGGIVGLNSGRIISCYSTGSISGDEYIGGVVGQNGLASGCIVSSGAIYNCYATGSVSGRNYIGGLIGVAKYGGFFSNCYAIGSVSGNENVGGLIGVNDRGEVSNSFWDIQTTGQTTSAGGEGKTTAQMQNPNTFMNSGWDFINKSDGPHDMWAEPVGGGYPILWWKLTPLPKLPTFSGGTGKSNDPYLISKAEELNNIGYNPRLMEAHFKLINDIDLSGINFFIIGKGPFEFAGVFDGNGKQISNFSYNSTDRDIVGLFGSVAGVIKDLGLINPNINAGTCNYVGSLAGNCSTISNCYAYGGSVAGGSYIGGLVGGGASYYATISNCFVEGTSISGNNYIGGLIGRNYATITNCYSICDISGESFIGGLTGSNYGLILNCYSAGQVTGMTETGGFIGSNRGIVRGSYWDIEASGLSTSAAGTGKKTAEMQTASTFVGWGCDSLWTIDNGADYPRLAWENKPGDTISNPTYGGGSGTEEDPYLIYTAEQFNWISLIWCDWDKHFRLMADIDLTGLGGEKCNTIGCYMISRINKPFSGVFDGNGHTISNFSCNSRNIDCIGLFSIVEGNNAQIKNLGLIAPNISADKERTGAIVGWMKSGYITGCYVINGNIEGDFVVGGFVGSNGGTITDSYVISITSGTRFVGGLAGGNSGTIYKCYADSSVSNPVTSSGSSGFGGLVGQNDGLISNCYSKGSVSANREYIGGLGVCRITSYSFSSFGHFISGDLIF